MRTLNQRTMIPMKTLRKNLKNQLKNLLPLQRKQHLPRNKPRVAMTPRKRKTLRRKKRSQRKRRNQKLRNQRRNLKRKRKSTSSICLVSSSHLHREGSSG